MLTEAEVLERALQLPVPQRALLAQKLLESLEAATVDDQDVDDAWADEVERRAVAYDRGEIPSSEAGEAIERVRKSLEGNESA